MNTVNDLFELVPRSDLMGIQTMIVDEPGRNFANHGEVRITSCFQPIFSPTLGRAVGFEALLRAKDTRGNAIAPLAMFDLSDEFDEVLLLDRLSCTVHVGNFLKQAKAEGWLFVNMNPQVFIESTGNDSFFSELLARYAFPRGRMVVELLDESDTDQGVLTQAIAACRAQGVLIAFDDFNANSADLDRVWALRPDIVKINRRLTEWAAKDGKTRHDLAAAIRALHDMGCLVLLQGVEAQEQAELALELQVDLVEGYLLGRPEFDIPGATSLNEACKRVGRGFREHALPALNRSRDLLAAYMSGLWSATVLLESDLSLDSAVQAISTLDGTVSCFLADAEGNQVGERIFAPHRTQERISTTGANYAHQPAFCNAWIRPGKIQVSEPSFNPFARVPCITLSTTVQAGGKMYVLCAEVETGRLGIH
jgi:EAL domain-containing protein (putative c-di-GMP-specific phosphodiesterase class I)